MMRIIEPALSSRLWMMGGHSQLFLDAADEYIVSTSTWCIKLQYRSELMVDFFSGSMEATYVYFN